MPSAGPPTCCVTISGGAGDQNPPRVTTDDYNQIAANTSASKSDACRCSLKKDNRAKIKEDSEESLDNKGVENIHNTGDTKDSAEDKDSSLIIPGSSRAVAGLGCSFKKGDRANIKDSEESLANTSAGAAKNSSANTVIIPGSPRTVAELTDLSDIGGELVNIPDQVMMDRMLGVLPYCLRGNVTHGFGRGSRQLGTPTANYPQDVVDSITVDLPTGVYFGWAKVDPWPVMKMVLNLGWNPFFANRSKSLEVYIMHEFPFDFYGAHMRICILGYLRPEAKFSRKEDLITAIRRDASRSSELLDTPEALLFRLNEYFDDDPSSEKK